MTDRIFEFLRKILVLFFCNAQNQVTCIREIFPGEIFITRDIDGRSEIWVSLTPQIQTHTGYYYVYCIRINHYQVFRYIPEVRFVAEMGMLNATPGAVQSDRKTYRIPLRIGEKNLRTMVNTAKKQYATRIRSTATLHQTPSPFV